MKDTNGLTEKEYLAKYDDSKYSKPSLTADIVICALDEILLIQRKNHPYINKWAFPGGFANKDEEILETAKRELEEETGVKDIPLTLLNVYSKKGRDPRGWVVSICYIANLLKKDIKVKASDDAKDARWFKVKDNKLISEDITITFDDLAFDHKDILLDALRR